MSMILDYWIIAMDIIILVILVRGMMILPKIQGMAEKMATDLINKKIKELWDHREDFKQPAEEFIMSIAQDMAKKQKPGMPAVPGMPGVEGLMGFLPKKYQGLAGLAMMFFGKNKNGNMIEGNSQNPFDK